MSTPVYKKLLLIGQAPTRVNRCIWICRELGIPFDLYEPTLFDDADTLFAESNGNMKQPACIDTDGTVLFESLAINLYLMRSHVAKAGG